MQTALRQLPAEQRRALVLSGFYGYTARDISELDGIPLGTVKTRIRMGLRKMRDLLRDDTLLPAAFPTAEAGAVDRRGIA